MSGGSFNYLCWHDVTTHFQFLEMAKFLESQGAYDAAAATMAFVCREDDPIRELWRAVEWWQSCDTGENHFLEALAKWRSLQSTEARAIQFEEAYKSMSAQFETLSKHMEDMKKVFG